MVELMPINKIFQLWNPDERIDMEFYVSKLFTFRDSALA